MRHGRRRQAIQHFERAPLSISLRTTGAGSPTAGGALQSWLIGDPDRLVADMQAVTAAIHGLVLEGHARLLDQAGSEQHPVTRHSDDVTLQSPEIGQENLDRLLLSARPALCDPLVPVGCLLLRARQSTVGR